MVHAVSGANGASGSSGAGGAGDAASSANSLEQTLLDELEQQIQAMLNNTQVNASQTGNPAVSGTPIS